MSPLISRFTRNLLLLSVLITGIGIILHFLLPALITPALLWIIPFFLLTTYLQFFILARNSEGKFSRFTNYYMAASVIKLLLLLAMITLYAFFFRYDILRFAITIFILYVTYTFFEVVWLMKLNAPDKSRKD